MTRILAAIFAAVLCTACAGHPKNALPKPLIKRIALIPATNPKTFTLYNATPPVGYPFQFWVNKADSGNKEQFLNDQIRVHPVDLAGDLTAEVATDLRGYGYTVEILDGVKRPADDLDNVDYDKIVTDADVIVHLWITEVGLYSSHTSAYYIPRVNAAGRMFVKGREDSLFSEDIYYGVDAKKGKSWAIAPDPKFAYRYFDDVISRLDEVRESFEIGAREVGKKLSEHINEAAK
jgi:hypothetical protein